MYTIQQVNTYGSVCYWAMETYIYTIQQVNKYGSVCYWAMDTYMYTTQQVNKYMMCMLSGSFCRVRHPVLLFATVGWRSSYPPLIGMTHF